MKNLCFWLFHILIISNVSLFAQQNNLQGAYKMKQGDVNALWLFADGYTSMIYYHDKVYMYTTGGPFALENNSITIETEYHDQDSTLIGQSVQHRFTVDDGNLRDSDGNEWVKQDAKDQGLDGLWRITGRMQQGEMGQIQRGDRKTIKLLIDGYFQWIAINPARRGFYGTGGGEYTFQDGRYAEHILFFSRDNTRIGTSLQFEGEVKGKEWHHTGLSSTGNKIYEIWTRE
ncbi:hypothetical protein ACFSQ3_00700 [Sphingobacterium corticis]|uniref:Membrane or secreted protein n=1 Tax=Sphingobacterium corticis TaxID=1812823 RepID=A0ABW5NFK3_9SPHI